MTETPQPRASLLARIQHSYRESDASAQLFKTKTHTVITIISAITAIWVLVTLTNWMFNAEWQVILDKRRPFLVGKFPADQMWRIWPGVWIFGALLGLSSGLWMRPGKNTAITIAAGLAILSFLLVELDSTAINLALILLLALAGYVVAVRAQDSPSIRSLVSRVTVVTWALLIPLMIILLFVGDAPPTSYWGGIFVNVMLAAIAIVVGTPVAVFLSLGRSLDGYPAIRIASTAFIEVVRGAPLIAWLFMGRFVLPFILPSWFGMNEADVIFRTMIVLILFNAAYTAEVIRGGLQAIPKGQYEAADSLGLGYFQTLRTISLPQAFRAVLPSLINQYIGLFKDTTLVYLISVVDVLEVGRKAFNELDYTGTALEVLVFVGFIFWLVTFSMSAISRRVEANMGLGSR